MTDKNWIVRNDAAESLETIGTIYLDKSDYYEELLHIYSSKNLEDKYQTVIHLRLLVNYNLMYRDNTFNETILNDVSNLIIVDNKQYFLIKDTIQSIIKIITSN